MLHEQAVEVLAIASQRIWGKSNLCIFGIRISNNHIFTWWIIVWCRTLWAELDVCLESRLYVVCGVLNELYAAIKNVATWQSNADDNSCNWSAWPPFFLHVFVSLPTVKQGPKNKESVHGSGVASGACQQSKYKEERQRKCRMKQTEQHISLKCSKLHRFFEQTTSGSAQSWSSLDQP